MTFNNFNSLSVLATVLFLNQACATEIDETQPVSEELFGDAIDDGLEVYDPYGACGDRKLLFDGRCRVFAYFESFADTGMNVSTVLKTEVDNDSGVTIVEESPDGLSLNFVQVLPEAARSSGTGRNGYRVSAIDEMEFSFSASTSTWTMYRTSRNLTTLERSYFLYEKSTSMTRTCESTSLADLEDSCGYAYADASGYICDHGADLMEAAADLYCQAAAVVWGVSTAIALTTGSAGVALPGAVGVGSAVALGVRTLCLSAVDLVVASGALEAAADTFCEDTQDGSSGPGGVLVGAVGTIEFEPSSLGGGDSCSALNGNQYEYSYAYGEGEDYTVSCKILEASDCHEGTHDGQCECDFTVVGDTCDGSLPDLG